MSIVICGEEGQRSNVVNDIPFLVSSLPTGSLLGWVIPLQPGFNLEWPCSSLLTTLPTQLQVHGEKVLLRFSHGNNELPSPLSTSLWSSVMHTTKKQESVSNKE